MDIDIEMCIYTLRIYIYIYVGVAYIHPRVNAYDVECVSLASGVNLPKYSSAIGSSSQVSCNRNI